MLHADKVIELLEPYPGRQFRMVEIVRYVASGRHLDLRGRRAVRKGVLRVLASLVDMGNVDKLPPHATRGAPTFYAWKVRHEVHVRSLVSIEE